MGVIKENLKCVNDKISLACKNCSRNADEVTLVAVSKFHPVQAMVEAIQAGQIIFGENRVQEAKEKYEYLTSLNLKFELHIIGSLQRNKVKDAVRISTCIQSVDRKELLCEIEKQCAKINKKIDILIEVHTGEESKSGFPLDDSLDEEVKNCVNNVYPHISLKGFMTMAPNTDDVELIKKSFSTLKDLQKKYRSMYTACDFKVLSMGMSGDYETAIEQGSTMVRVGTAIFGHRDYTS